MSADPNTQNGSNLPKIDNNNNNNTNPKKKVILTPIVIKKATYQNKPSKEREDENTPSRKVSHLLEGTEFAAKSDQLASVSSTNLPTENTSESNQKVKVLLRIRPFLPNEQQDDQYLSINSKDSSLIINEETYQITQTFDRAFDENAQQIDVFRPFQEQIERVLEGYNFTILAYGQTGSGKTYTMFGCDWECFLDEQQPSQQLEKNSIRRKRFSSSLVGPTSSSLPYLYSQKQQHQTTFYENLDSDVNYAGIIPRTIYALFALMNQRKTTSPGQEIAIYCSFLQIYNEKIYDLLAETNNGLKPLEIHESKLDGIFVEGLSEYQTNHYLDTLALMKRGERNRAIRATSMNAKSSRSHTIFQLIVETLDKTNGEIKRARLNMCDLAGSEKMNKKESIDGGHFNELKNINLSLSTLGKVISSLSSSKQKLPAPFRESKLTRILQESLVGNTLTYVLANISPVLSNIEETVSTLKFAERARHITTSIKPNQINAQSDENLKKLQREVIYLKEILNLRRKGQTAVDITSKFLKLQAENEKLKKDHISMREVEKLIEENRQMKAEIQQIYMNQSTHTLNDNTTAGSNSNIHSNQINDVEDILNKIPVYEDSEQLSPRQTQRTQPSPVLGQQDLANLRKEQIPYLTSNSKQPNPGQHTGLEQTLKHNKSFEKIPNNSQKQSLFSAPVNTAETSNNSRQITSLPLLNVNRSFNSNLYQHPQNISSTYSSMYSRQSSQRGPLGGTNNILEGNTPIKIRIRGKEQYYQAQDGYAEISDLQLQQQEKERRDKRRILDRLDQLEKIQKYHQEKLQKEMEARENTDKSMLKKQSSINVINPASKRKSQSISDYQKQTMDGLMIDKKAKSLKIYSDKIKLLEKRYFSAAYN